MKSKQLMIKEISPFDSMVRIKLEETNENLLALGADTHSLREYESVS